MTLFGFSKKKKEKPAPLVKSDAKHAATVATPGASTVRSATYSGGSARAVMGVASSGAIILQSPRITEKATDVGERGVYVFNVAPEANKKTVAAAVKSVYQVSPIKVRLVRIRAKVRRSMRTGRIGGTPGGKKAYVYLKKGETITIS